MNGQMRLNRRQLLAGAGSALLCPHASAAAQSDSSKPHTIDVRTPQDLKDFFHYTKDRIAFISSHRGGPRKGFPENCLATFDNTLRHTYSLIEIDPHYTKDGAIVLMHDPTLDRTSAGHGQTSDYTLEELKKLKLKDPYGNVTGESIPTLDEALEWAKGKTILILDQKNVPIEMRIKKIEEHYAEAHAIVMAYSFADAEKSYRLNPNVMMEVFIPTGKEAAQFDATGVPWSSIVAFVTHLEPKDSGIFKMVHEKGAMCIRGSSRNIDKEYTTGKIDRAELMNGYHRIIESGADIVEADLGIEAGEGVRALRPANSSKQKYFRLPRA